MPSLLSPNALSSEVQLNDHIPESVATYWQVLHAACRQNKLTLCKFRPEGVDQVFYAVGIHVNGRTVPIALLSPGEPLTDFAARLGRLMDQHGGPIDMDADFKGVKM